MFNWVPKPQHTTGRRVRCGFAKSPSANNPREDLSMWGHYQDPFESVVVVPHHTANASVSSALTMDTELETLATAAQKGGQTTQAKANDYDTSCSSACKEPAINFVHENDTAMAHVQMTKSHNIQSENTTSSSHTTRAMVAKCCDDDARKAPVKRSETALTVGESYDTADIDEVGYVQDVQDIKSEGDHIDAWFCPSSEESPVAWFYRDEEESPVDSGGSMLDSNNNNNKNNVNVTLEDFDFDHLNLLMGDAYVDADEYCDEGNPSIVRQLQHNSPSLYWLQLTNELTNPAHWTAAIRINTVVRNVTVYPAALQGLASNEEKAALVDSICHLKSLQNLIVFQDGGNLFLEPLCRYHHPLRRLTLYKLDFTQEKSLLQLATLLKRLPDLEELSLEKYQGLHAGQLLMVMAEVLPYLTSLKKLTLTPARSVKLTSNGPFAFFRAMKCNTTIQTLSLQGSEDSIDQACINELVNTLQMNNTTLEEVKLNGFWRSRDAFWKRFEEKSRSQISYFLKLNRAGIRRMQLDQNINFERLKGALLSQVDNLDHIFYLLLNNPLMVQALVIPADTTALQLQKVKV